MSGKRKIEPGDLCMIVRAPGKLKENLGALVLVTRRAVSKHGFWRFKEASRPLKCNCGALILASEDHPDFVIVLGEESLMPIRDAEGEDEILHIAGKPQPLERVPA